MLASNLVGIGRSTLKTTVHDYHNGHLEMAKWLIVRGCSPTEKSIAPPGKDCGEGYNPLGLAAQHGHYEMVKYLMQEGAGASQTQKDGCGDTPLHLALIACNLPILEYLLLHGWWDQQVRNPEQERTGEWWLLNDVEKKALVDGTLPYMQRHLQSVGWLLPEALQRKDGRCWSLKAHVEYPSVFHLFCQIGMWCLNVKIQEGKMPQELVGTLFCFWPIDAFSPRLKLLPLLHAKTPP
eukprot:TRINITY_DN67026_c1_g2_i4.p1 TRINITY_DN67026_c1_g2~~TRINITY_DN67026_c1_g2_i4.p1  ORF type:complete len:237 (-),score=27.76 TRINITY_DN67026_c1_g2_i4:260-970(-)